MSKHPLGPWTQTDRVTYVSRTGEVVNTGNGSGTNKGYQTRYYFDSDVRTGVNNGRRIKEPSSASRLITETRVKNWEASTRWYHVNNGVWCTTSQKGSNTYFPTIPTLLSSAVAENRAYQSLIKKQGQTMDLLTSIGEFKETKETLVHAFNVLTGGHNEAYKSLVKDLLKHKSAAPIAIAKIISDAWLEFHFGILPTLSDADNLLKTTANAMNDGNRRLEHQAATGVEEDFGLPVTTLNSESVVVSHTTKTSKKCVCKMGYTITSDINKKISVPDSFGLSLGDVVPTLYELTPYSWLLDYFTNTSDFLNLMKLQRGIAVNGWKVIINEAISALIDEPVGPPTGIGTWPWSFVKEPTTGLMTGRQFSFTRNPFNVDTFIPSFEYECPNLAQAANIAALAGSRLIKPRNASAFFSPSRAREINGLLRRGGL